MSIRNWWYWFRVKRTVDKYLHHEQELNEWSYRFDPADDKEVAKQTRNIASHTKKKEDALLKLYFTLGLPHGRWIPLDDDVEVFIGKEGLQVRRS